MTQRKTVRLDFHSTFDMLDFVQVVSDHIGRLAGLDDEALHWVGVAVRESVINAIKHGNGNDEQKRVHVEFTPLGDGDPAGHRHSRPRRRARLRPGDAPRSCWPPKTS